MSGFYRGPGGTGDATGDAVNEATLAIAAASAASTSATSASTSATNAATSATNAAASAASAASTLATAVLKTNNLSDLSSISTARTNLGVTATGSDTTYAYRANNLSDLASVVTARTNLGLVASATTDTTNATNISSGTLGAARLPAFTGDSTSTAGTSALTLATVNSNVGAFGSSSSIPVVTVNAKGLVTAVSTATVAGGQYFGTASTKSIAYNSTSIAENITTTTGNNCLSVGPITVATGFAVTVATGQRWVIL